MRPFNFTLALTLALALFSASIYFGVAAFPAAAESVPKAKHKVVFDLSVNDPASFKTLLGNIRNLRKALGPENVQVRVVAYAKGLDLLLLKGGELANEVDQLASEGVTFDVCQNTVKARKAALADLRPKSVVIDSGVAELVRLQEEGWSYIKVASYHE